MAKKIKKQRLRYLSRNQYPFGNIDPFYIQGSSLMYRFSRECTSNDNIVSTAKKSRVTLESNLNPLAPPFMSAIPIVQSSTSTKELTNKLPSIVVSAHTPRKSKSKRTIVKGPSVAIQTHDMPYLNPPDDISKIETSKPTAKSLTKTGYPVSATTAQASTLTTRLTRSYVKASVKAATPAKFLSQNKINKRYFTRFQAMTTGKSLAEVLGQKTQTLENAKRVNEANKTRSAPTMASKRRGPEATSRTKVTTSKRTNKTTKSPVCVATLTKSTAQNTQKRTRRRGKKLKLSV